MSMLLKKSVNPHKMQFSENELLDEAISTHKAQYERLVNSHTHRISKLEEEFKRNIKLFEDTHNSYISMLKKISSELEDVV